VDESKNYLEELADKILALYLRSETFFNNYGSVLKEEHLAPFNQTYYPMLLQIRKSSNGVPIGSDIFKLESKRILEQRFSKVKDLDKRIESVNFEYQTCASIIDYLFSLELDESYITGKVVDLIKEIKTAALLKTVLDSKSMTGEYKLADHLNELIEVAGFRIDTGGGDGEEVVDVARNQCIEHFPHDAIKGFVQRVADLYANTLESPYPFWVFNAAVCLGNILASRVRLRTSLFPYPTMYVICLGPSGETRKSESGKQMIRFFGIWDRRRRHDEKVGQEEIVPYLRVVHGIGSAEGLMESLKTAPNCVVFFDELRSFVQKCQVQGSNLLQIVNTLFDDTHYQNIVKKKTQEVTNAKLSIIGCSTVETWNSMFTSSFINIGFINRLWLVPGEGKRKEFLPPEIPEHKINSLYSRLHGIFDLYPNGTVLELDLDAYDLLQEWYMSSKSGGDSTKRLETYGLRILMIMALSEKKHVIDVEMAKRCIQLLDWQKEVREIYHPVEFANITAQIENLIRKCIMAHPGITKRNLFNQIGSKRFDIQRVDKAVESLIQNKEISEIPSRGTTKYEYTGAKV